MKSLRLVSVFVLLASVYSKVLVGFEENNVNVDDRDDVTAEEKKDPLEYNIENRNVKMDEDIQGGDMKFTPKQLEAMKNGNAKDRSLAFSNWRTGTGSFVNIPYVIDKTSKYSEDGLQNIKGAMDQYREKTCIRFVPRTSEADYLHIYKGSGCWSYVGKLKNGGKQEVSLGDGCVYQVGTPIHEFMHAIGYFHEQSRKDRDQFVKINMTNVRKGTENNFEVCKDCDLQGLKYDIGSVMHYHSKAFSTNGKPTIIALGANSGKQLGQRNGFSALDIEGINKVYCECSVDADCWKKELGKACNGGVCGEATTPAPATTTTAPVCKDSGKYSHKQCRDRAIYCGSAKYGKFMEDHCKKSCGLCPDSDGLRNEGKECWTASCNGQGPCAFCGNGLCCMKNFKDTTKGCDGSIGGDGYHQCVAKP